MFLAALGAASRAAGQTAEDYREDVERLVAQWRNAMEAESLDTGRFDPDTVSVGAFTLLTKPEIGDLVRDAAETARRRILPMLQADTILLGREPIFVLERDDRRAWAWAEGIAPVLAIEDEWEAAYVADLLLGTLGRRIATGLDETAALWLGREVPVEPLSPESRERTYVELATDDSRSVAQCYRGDIRACRTALGMARVADPVQVWYSPQQRRRWVERVTYMYVRELSLKRDCVEAGLDGACVALMSKAPQAGLIPLSGTARRLLVQLALESGGHGAYSRLLGTDAESIDGRLAAVANIEPDSLVAVWRAAVMASRPEATPASASLAAVALAWIILMAFLASRSSRWRSG